MTSNLSSILDRGPESPFRLDPSLMLDAVSTEGWTPLHCAVFRGHKRIAEWLIDKGGQSIIHSRDAQGRTALHKAAVSGHADCLRLLLQRGAEVDTCDLNNETPLLCSISRGSRMCVSLLINHGASIYATLKNPPGYCSLHQAVRFGFIECIKLLARNGIRTDLPSIEHQETPLHVAARYGRTDCIPILVDSTHSSSNLQDGFKASNDLVTLKAQTRTGQSALHIAAESGQLRWFEELLSYGADLQACDHNGRSVLHSAASRGNTDTVALLLSSWGADLNSIDDDGLSPLLCAVMHRRYTCAQLLVESVTRWKASCPVTQIESDHMGRNALHWAAIHNQPDFGLYLLTNTNISIDDLTTDGDSVLHLACAHGHDQFLHLLLSNVFTSPDQAALSHPTQGDLPSETDAASFHGPLSLSQGAKISAGHTRRTINIDATNDEGRTALHVAAAHGHVDCLVRLLESKSKQEIRDRWGQTALHLAAAHGHENCVKELVDRGSEKNAQSSKGNSPLHLAARNGHCKCITLLGSQGANLNAINSDRDTPLHEAARSNHHNCVTVLLKLKAQQLPGLFGFFPIHYAAINGDIASPLLPSPGAGLIMSKGRPSSNAVFTDDKGRNALHYAVAKGHGPLLLHLIECGYDLTAPDFMGWTALHYAAYYGQKVILNTICAHPRFESIMFRSTTVPRDGSRTVVHLLLQSPHFRPDVLRFLLEKDRSLATRQSSNRKNPLHFAVTSNQLEAVAILLEFIDDHKQNVAQTDLDGHSVLYYSLCFPPTTEITLLLCDKIRHPLRAELQECTNSALDMAVVLDEVQAVEFLVSRLRQCNSSSSFSLEETRSLARRLERQACLDVLNREVSSGEADQG